MIYNQKEAQKEANWYSGKSWTAIVHSLVQLWIMRRGLVAHRAWYGFYDILESWCMMYDVAQ